MSDLPFSSEQIQCKQVVGASSVKLRSSKRAVAHFGKDCEFVRLARMSANPGCKIGGKVRILGVYLQQNPCNTSVLKQAFEYIRSDCEYSNTKSLLTFVYSQIFLSV